MRKNRPKRVVLVTECSMADNVQAELPDVEFMRPCNLCPHMKRITLPKILDSLLHMKEEVVVDPAIAAKARRGRAHDLSEELTRHILACGGTNVWFGTSTVSPHAFGR